ncbi:unnamed protein product [Medioppia subpectinata]|uniref:protein-serine/threonine phosphatase n=1 Tax=Medioppia subpectinata TaxID=1979941 RepID=A0A7R9Q0G3_9ACAR|nr:unnamed protein product [Medioppia subpectinata]CAG2108103.1 unnamed protein product [Medioppia subpectinata]
MNNWWREPLKTCTPEELEQIIVAPNYGQYILPTDSYNQVFDNIFLGDETIARNIALLKSLSISHVLNAAFGNDLSLNMVNISEKLYSESGIQWMPIGAIDMSSFNLFQYFDESALFIHSAIIAGHNVLVHCKEGISRSATLVVSYLMIIRGMTAQEAIRQVRQNREIRPNDGFLRQLCYLNDRLFDTIMDSK